MATAHEEHPPQLGTEEDVMAHAADAPEDVDGAGSGPADEGAARDATEASKRKRWKPKPEERALLEAVFNECRLPNRKLVEEIAQMLDVSLHQVRIWFQNRRQRMREDRPRQKPQHSPRQAEMLGRLQHLPVSRSTAVARPQPTVAAQQAAQQAPQAMAMNPLMFGSGDHPFMAHGLAGMHGMQSVTPGSMMPPSLAASAYMASGFPYFAASLAARQSQSAHLAAFYQMRAGMTSVDAAPIEEVDDSEQGSYTTTQATAAAAPAAAPQQLVVGIPSPVPATSMPAVTASTVQTEPFTDPLQPLGTPVTPVFGESKQSLGGVDTVPLPPACSKCPTAEDLGAEESMFGAPEAVKARTQVKALAVFPEYETAGVISSPETKSVMCASSEEEDTQCTTYLQVGTHGDDFDRISVDEIMTALSW